MHVLEVDERPAPAKTPAAEELVHVEPVVVLHFGQDRPKCLRCETSPPKDDRRLNVLQIAESVSCEHNKTHRHGVRVR